MGKRVRTALDREVDQELISEGKDALKDFDESQAFHVPAKGRGRLERAFRFAASVHRDQKRKGTEIPYITHLMAVAAMVGENGGNEAKAAAERSKRTIYRASSRSNP